MISQIKSAETLAVGDGYVAVTSDSKTGTSIWNSKTGEYIRTLWQEAFFLSITFRLMVHPFMRGSPTGG